jgi:hypothetical protein
VSTPFAYPKVRHVRSQKPGPFTQYQRFKPFLREEFSRKCVYCREPDGLKGKDSFGVDHYRPKKDFPQLSCVYENLFYCCGPCNRRKGRRWALPRLEATHFIPNPCDHVMFSHLQFQEGIVGDKTLAGKYAVECLDLNDPVSVEHRQFVGRLIARLEQQREEAETAITKVREAHRSGRMDDATARSAQHDFEAELQIVERDLASVLGNP